MQLRTEQDYAATVKSLESAGAAIILDESVPYGQTDISLPTFEQVEGAVARKWRIPVVDAPRTAKSIRRQQKKRRQQARAARSQR